MNLCQLCHKRAVVEHQGIKGRCYLCDKCSRKPYETRQHILGTFPETIKPSEMITEQLRSWLHLQNFFYYQMDNPEASDIEYDEAFRELQKREITEGSPSHSPTNIVGSTSKRPEWPPAGGIKRKTK